MRIISVILGAVALVLATLAPTSAAAAAPAAPASAAPAAPAPASAARDWFYIGAGTAACPNRHLCLWVQVNFGAWGVAWPAGRNTADFATIPCHENRCTDPRDGFDDEASSWYNNNTGLKYCVSEHAFGGGRDNTMPNGTHGNFTTTGWNDLASSLSYIGCP
ncbi:peptidase inhibitor family I36 protein [Nonomuraea typhae]|uniref:Peptidase inhibitor family I36 protein n=1 Tax=Nonomuraea typhae TaxID=2603600 RepID=A0ABW7YSG2_9ACTN